MGRKSPLAVLCSVKRSQVLYVDPQMSQMSLQVETGELLVNVSPGRYFEVLVVTPYFE